MNIFNRILTAHDRFEARIDSYSEEQIERFIERVSWTLVGFCALLFTLAFIVIPILRCEGVIQ